MVWPADCGFINACEYLAARLLKMNPVILKRSYSRWMGRDLSAFLLLSLTTYLKEWPENLSSETSQLTERGEDGLLRLLQLEQKRQEESLLGFARTLPNLVRADFSPTWQSQSIVLAFKQQVIEMLYGTHRRS
ncbi:hypothetical protein PO909_017046 [Leuciscus waleckii]